jgi:hypothetical protein
MPSKSSPPAPIGREDFAVLVDAIVAAVGEKLTLPVLLPQAKVWGYLGISRSAFFRAKGTTGFPRAVSVPGSGPHYRRTDLDSWAARLKGHR